MPRATLIRKNNVNQDYNALPSVLKTPSGLALLEIQGSIYVGSRPLIDFGHGLGLLQETQQDEDNEEEDKNYLHFDNSTVELQKLGRFDFSNLEKGGNEVLLYIGDHQRLRGKIVQLKTPLAVLQMNPHQNCDGHSMGQDNDVNMAPPSSNVSIDSTRDNYHRQVAYDEKANVEIPILEIIRHKLVFATRPEPVVY